MKLTQGPIAQWLKPWVSLWLTIHLFALVICLAANRTTSELGRRLVRLLAPHSVVLHQDYGGVSLGLTQGETVDCHHQLEFHFRDAEAYQAHTQTSSIVDRRWQSFQQMLAIAAHEKNEEIVQLCFDYAIAQLPEDQQSQVDRIRLVRTPTLAIATHRLVKQGELPDSELAPLTLFECSLVRLSGDRIKLVPVLEKTRRAKSLQSARGATDGQK